MKFLLVVFALALAGCNTLPQAGVDLPPSLTRECLPLQKLEGITGADMLKNIVANAEIYYECADAHKKLIEAVAPKESKPNK